MPSDGTTGLIAAFRLLAIVLLGYVLIVRGVLTGLTGTVRPLPSPVDRYIGCYRSPGQSPPSF